MDETNRFRSLFDGEKVDPLRIPDFLNNIEEQATKKLTKKIDFIKRQTFRLKQCGEIPNFRNWKSSCLGLSMERSLCL